MKTLGGVLLGVITFPVWSLAFMVAGVACVVLFVFNVAKGAARG